MKQTFTLIAAANYTVGFAYSILTYHEHKSDWWWLAIAIGFAISSLHLIKKYLNQ